MRQWRIKFSRFGEWSRRARARTLILPEGAGGLIGDRGIFAGKPMQLQDRFKKQKRDRFQRFNIVFPILLAGWVPSILTLVVSYKILTNMLESKILRDRQIFL